MINLLNSGKPFFALALLLVLLAGCSQPAAPTATPPPPTATPAPTAPPTEPAATATREGNRVMLPYRNEGAGITLFHPPTWTAELDPVSGLLLLAPEAAAGFRDISNALIVAAPSSIVGQGIVPGEEALTEARAEAAMQFLLANFATSFVPDISLGDEITIVEEGRRVRASVPYTGTTLQDIPVSGTLNLIIEGEQVAGALTTTTGGEAITDLLAEMVGSISLNPPAG